jgi:hypothetical protein
VTLTSANATGNNFSRTAPYSISGSFSGVPAGAQSPAPIVYLSNGRSVVAAKAGTGGSRYWAYTLNNVPAGQYSVSAFLYGYNIVPSGFANPLTISGNATGINFSGSSSSTVAGAITGRITQYGVPLVGVNVSALQGGSTVGSVSSDSDGYYRIDDLPGGAYTVIANKPGYSFSPASISVSSVPSIGNNFTASGLLSPPTLSSVTATPAVIPSLVGNTTLSAVANGSGPLTYSWDALVAAAPVTFSVNDSTGASSSSASVQAPGSYTFRVRVADTNGFAVTGTVGVTVSAGPGAMVVSPYEVQVSGRKTVAFSADAWDQLGNRITISPAWTVSGGGVIDGSGLFSAATAGGPFLVTASVAGLSSTGLVWVTSSSTNVAAPKITTEPLSQAVAVGANVTFSVAAGGAGPLSYQWLLGTNSIAGATASSYTRTNVQSVDAGSYTVVVTNSAGSVISSNAMLTVNNAPVLAPISNRTVHAGSTVTLTNSATDPDSPPQTLTFSLDPGFPPGATIDPASGRFNWPTTTAQAQTTNSVTVRVTDNGTPSLSAAQSFVITVVAPLTVQSISVANGSVAVSWSAVPGTTYLLQYKNSLSDSAWTPLMPSIIATGVTASMTDALGTTQRFYRIMLPQ